MSEVLAQAITANDLRTGEVVFRGLRGWTPRLAEAERFAPQSPQAGLALAAAQAETTVVVDAYLIDVSLESGAPVPLSYRERIRALGPPVHPELGKQAEGGAAIEAIARATGGARSTGRVALIRRK
jgi:hypothetical protein